MMQDKINSALDLIEESLFENHNPVVAFSGGKDSTVVLHLVRSVDPNVKALFNNTYVEYDETIPYVRSIDNLDETIPIKGFWLCAHKYKLPKVKAQAKSHGNRCCYYMKEKPALDYYRRNKNDLVFTGLTMAESWSRRQTLMRTGPYYYMKTWKINKCHPIYNWTVDDVWNFIRSNKIPYNSCYDPPRSEKRCGCEPCTAYISWPRRLLRTKPELFKTLMEMKRKEEGQSSMDDYECPGGA